MSKLHLAVVQLLLCTNISRSLTKSQTSAKPPRLNILYLSDTPMSESAKTFLAQFEKTLTHNSRLNETVQLTFQELSQNTTSLDTLRVLDKCVRWKETAIVILNLENENIQKTVLCGFTELVFDIKTRPRNMQQKSYDVLTVKPSLTQLYEAVETIFGSIGYTKMPEIECLSHQMSDIRKMEQMLENIKGSTHTFIFVKCLENLDLILQYANKIGLTTGEFRWVFPGMVALKGLSTKLPQNVIAIDLPGANDQFKPMGDVNVLFLADALDVLEKTLKNNVKELFGEKNWNYAKLTTSLKRYIVNNQFLGHTGEVLFNINGQRSGETYKIFELIKPNGIHHWLPIGLLEKGNVKILLNQWRLEDKIQEKPVLRVVTRLKSPYLMFRSAQDINSLGECEIGRVCRQFTKANDTLTDDNTTTIEYKCCIGLIIDLLEKLEEDVGFDSQIHLVKDGMFGSNDPKTRRWNGMIGELVRNEADMAASTLTITAKRSEVVDFTYPYVDIANGILVSAHPVLHNAWDFVFLDSFSGSLWLALLIAIQVKYQ